MADTDDDATSGENQGNVYGLEPTAAEEVDEGECAYEECDEDADYRVEVAGEVTTLMCDDCSRENRIWVQENDLLDGEELR